MLQNLSDKTPLMQSDSELNRFAADPPFQDVWASVLFVLHLLALIALTIYSSLLPPVDNVNSNDFWLVSWLGSLHGRQFWFALLLLFGCIIIGMIWALFLVALMRSNATAMIWISLIFCCTLSVALTVYCFIVGPVYVACVMLFFTLINLAFIFLAYRRIPFTAQLLTTVAHVSKLFPGLMLQSFISLAFWLAYLSLFFAASSMSSRIVVLQGWHLIGLLLTFFWTQQVAQNFSHVVASGITASWYFNSSKSPTAGALYRACTTSFGSICFGSLIVGLIKTFDAVCRLLLFANHKIISFFVRLLLRIIESLVEWFNTYAFAYCAIYGMSYIDSAKRSWHLLMHRGCMAIVNDSLVNGVTIASAYCGGVIAALVAVFVNWPLGIAAGSSFIAAVAFVTGFSTTLLLMESISSAVTTLFVCLAEAPEQMRELRPSLYDSIQTLYPQVVSAV